MLIDFKLLPSGTFTCRLWGTVAAGTVGDAAQSQYGARRV